MMIYVWLVVWNIFIFPYIGNFIIPTDEYFSEELKPPTSSGNLTYNLWGYGITILTLW